MYPILADFAGLKIYSYGFCIMLGAFLAYFYASRQSKHLGIGSDTISEMALLIIVSAVVGGKVFLWFSDWDYYMKNPSKMIELNGNGFVFYGSFIFCITALFLFFRYRKVKAAPMFDVLAVCTAIVHAFGKLGCFFAGCCYGKTCSPSMGVVYNHPLSQASPLHTPLYPVPLIDAVILFSAALFLWWYRSRKKFNGELMLWYIFIYATGRFFTEFLRGDDSRGFIGPLSQSQWVSIALLIIAGILYKVLSQRAALPTHRK
jgi:phosphatidylglycerol:prolipoprotein diacylglycerol transferase